MSGRFRQTTITITEEEYRRLHEMDMQHRFGPELEQIQTLERQIAALRSRLAQPQPGGEFHWPDHRLKIETSSGPIYVDEQVLYDLLGDEKPGSEQLLESLASSAPNFLARSLIADYRRAVAMLRPQLTGMAHYEAERRRYARQLLAIFRGEPRPVEQRQADPALRRRLRIAARLQQVIRQAGYRYAGVECTDSTRTTALVHLGRAGDGSRVTLVVNQEGALFEAARPAAEQAQETSILASPVSVRSAGPH